MREASPALATLPSLARGSGRPCLKLMDPYLIVQGTKLVISRVIIRVTPFRALITPLITYLLSPLPLGVPK